jgi:hypothetical protein
VTYLIKAATNALNALLKVKHGQWSEDSHEGRQLLVALSTALAEAEKAEPVAWMRNGWGPDCGLYVDMRTADEMRYGDKQGWTPLYAHPPATKQGPT